MTVFKRDAIAIADNHMCGFESSYLAVEVATQGESDEMGLVVLGYLGEVLELLCWREETATAITVIHVSWRLGR